MKICKIIMLIDWMAIRFLKENKNNNIRNLKEIWKNFDMKN